MFNVATTRLDNFSRGMGDLPEECAADITSCRSAVLAAQNTIADLGRKLTDILQFWNNKKLALFVAPPYENVLFDSGSGSPSPSNINPSFRAQLQAYIDQRIDAVKFLEDRQKDAYYQLRAKLSDLQTKLLNRPTPIHLTGIGAITLIDTSSLESVTAAEQAKMNAFSNYWTTLVSALSSGQTPPPLPADSTATNGAAPATSWVLMGAAAIGAILLLGGMR